MTPCIKMIQYSKGKSSSTPSKIPFKLGEKVSYFPCIFIISSVYNFPKYLKFPRKISKLLYSVFLPPFWILWDQLLIGSHCENKQLMCQGIHSTINCKCKILIDYTSTWSHFKFRPAGFLKQNKSRFSNLHFETFDYDNHFICF